MTRASSTFFVACAKATDGAPLGPAIDDVLAPSGSLLRLTGCGRSGEAQSREQLRGGLRGRVSRRLVAGERRDQRRQLPDSPIVGRVHDRWMLRRRRAGQGNGRLLLRLFFRPRRLLIALSRIGFAPRSTRGATPVRVPGPGRFLPGTVVVGRYRVVGPLGRGGMGEVYRADELKLGQPVALKFLPREVERGEHRLQRSLQEVRAGTPSGRRSTSGGTARVRRRWQRWT